MNIKKEKNNSLNLNLFWNFMDRKTKTNISQLRGYFLIKNTLEIT